MFRVPSSRPRCLLHRPYAWSADTALRETGVGDGGGEGQAFSGLQQALTTTPGYNQRVSECEEAAAALLARVARGGGGGERAWGERGDGKQTTVLSDVSVTQFREHATVLSAAQLKRATHFFGECARVQQGVQAWKAGDVQLFGRLMNESGLSSIHNYQCGCVIWPYMLHPAVHLTGGGAGQDEVAQRSEAQAPVVGGHALTELCSRRGARWGHVEPGASPWCSCGGCWRRRVACWARASAARGGAGAV
jgi:hypothetical protein